MTESADDAVPRVDGERRVVDAEDLQVDVVAEACRMPLCNAGSRAIEHAVSARMRIPPPRSARQMRTPQRPGLSPNFFREEVNGGWVGR